MGRKVISGIIMLLIVILLSSVFTNFKVATAVIGSNDNGILVTKWKYSLRSPSSHTGAGMFFGSSPAIADLGVNSRGGEPDSDLEIVTGSDEYGNYYPEIPGYTYGIWRAFDSNGFVEWALDTQSDEARSSPNIIDIDGDGNVDIVAGTTSGWVVEAVERTGVFKWTFPSPPQRSGPFAWHSSPAIADLDPTVSGLEVVIGNTFQGYVYALDGDNRDGVNDGITADVSWYPVPGGTEGVDWDVLWMFQTGGSIISSPAIGNLDLDAELEVVIGSADGNIYCLNGKTGSLEWKYATGGAVDASPGLADFDSDGHSEVVIGSADGNVYFISGDENSNGLIDASEVTFFSTGNSIHSSAALGDVDNDGNIEVILGSSDFNVYSFDYNSTINTVALNWLRATGGPVVSSPALADRTNVGVYSKDWPMFRNNPKRNGFYGPAPSGGLDVYVGSDDGSLYLLDGNTGAVIDRFQTFGPIHTSPSVADVDGDEHLEIAFYDWGYDSGYSDTFWLLRDTLSPGFYLDVSPDQNTAYQGDYVTYDVNATSYNNFSDPITFDVFGLPPNTISTLNPNPATPPHNGSIITVLNVTTTIDTPPGEYILSIRGASGAEKRTVTALITVVGADFAIDASPNEITVYQRQSAIFTVSVTSLAGFSSPVMLTVSGMPPNSSASFSPNPATPPPYGTSDSTLTISTTSITPPGAYNLYITGTSGSTVRSIPLLYRTIVVVPSACALVVRGLDNRVYYRSYNSSTSSWSSWNAVPSGSTCDSPASALCGNELHVVVRGMDGYSLWHGYVNLADDTFSDWTLLSGSTPSAPTLTSNGTALSLVVQGQNNLIYYRFYDCASQTWTDWTALPSGATCDSPAAAFLANKLHITVRGMDGFTLWHSSVDLSTGVFSGWDLIGGATESKPTLATCEARNEVCLVVRGLNNVIYRNAWTGSSWAGWVGLPTGSTCDGVGATAMGEALHVVVRGMDGYTLWHANVDLKTGAFSGWTLLDGSTPSPPTPTS